MFRTFKISTILLLVIAFVTAGCTVIPSGKVGVRSHFGKIKKEELQPGVHLWIPVIVGISKVDVRTQNFEMAGRNAVQALSKDGLNITVDCSLLYHIQPDKAAEMLIEFGSDIQYKILTPVVRATIRDVIARYESSTVYQKRDVVKKEALEDISDKLKKRYIIVEDFLIRNISLPESVAQAIERKRKAFEEKEQMKFILEKEKLEAERKKVEARGIAEANKIIANSLTDKYLTWYFFKNIKAYAEGNNNAVILIPYDSKLMPLINIPATSGAGK
jgi:regulator of protease activity HflC (stomatin/prohibitin superfamily)